MPKKIKKALYIQFFNPMHCPVLIHGCNILSHKGWKLLLLGAQNIADPSNRMEMKLHKNITIKLLEYAKPGMQQRLQYLFFNLWILLTIIFWRPQVLYASEKLVCPIAYIIKIFSNKIKVIYFEPMYAGEGSQIRPRFVRVSRAKLAKIADLCLVPNEARLEKFVNDVGTCKNIIFVYQFPRREEFHDISLKEKPAGTSRLKLFSFGHIGPDRLPIQLFEALEKLKDKVELVISGVIPEGVQNYGSTIKKEIKNRGLEENIEYVGLIKERDDLYRQCSKADVGLTFTGKTIKPEFRTEGGSQRPFEMMGLGLVPLVSDLKEWEDFFVKDGYAYSCNSDSADSIKTALEFLYENRSSLYEIGERNKKKILEEWNYNSEFKKVESYIESPHDPV